MEIKEFKKYTNNLHEYSADDVDSFEFMSSDELRVYQDELERNDGGNLSSWDHVRAFITMKMQVAGSVRQVEVEEEGITAEGLPMYPFE